jgi:hypothetical protein
MEEKYQTEYRYGSKWNQRKDHLYKYMECKRCGQMESVCEDTTAVTCSDCVSEMVDPIEPSYKKSDKPRGWTLMAEFIDVEGNVYHRGIVQPELKGTKEPTKVEKSNVPAKRMTKKEKQELVAIAAINLHRLKKELSKTRWKKDKKILMSKIKLHTKIATEKFPRNFNRQEYIEEYKK